MQKPIDRNIQGVIKVGQAKDENVQQELEEYVVTKELQKHFKTILMPTNGVSIHQQIKWVFGFRGSLVQVNLIS